MGVKLLESLEMQTNTPLDKRAVVKTVSERNAISKTVRYLGMQVYVSDEKKRYELKNGTDDSHWEEIKAVAKASELVTDDEHLTVSTTEKNKWNGKADGNHNHDSVYAKTSHKHNATDITQDTTHKFVTDTQISGWESKAAGDHNHDNTYATKTHTHVATQVTEDATHRFVTDTDKSNWNGKAAGNHNHNDLYANKTHGHQASEITGLPQLPESLKNPHALTIQLNGAGDVVYDGSAVKSVNITAASIGAQVAGDYAAATHTHSEYQAKGDYALATHNHDSVYAPTVHTHTEYLSSQGNITVNGNLTVTGEILSNNNVTAYSDIRVKKNIRDIDDSVIEKLKKVRFCNFEYKDCKDDRKRVGVIAQELEELFPELVFEDHNGIKTVDYTGLNVYFAFAMQKKLFG